MRAINLCQKSKFLRQWGPSSSLCSFFGSTWNSRAYNSAQWSNKNWYVDLKHALTQSLTTCDALGGEDNSCTFIRKNVIEVNKSTVDFKSCNFSGLEAGKLFLNSQVVLNGYYIFSVTYKYKPYDVGANKSDNGEGKEKKYNKIQFRSIARWKKRVKVMEESFLRNHFMSNKNANI